MPDRSPYIFAKVPKLPAKYAHYIMPLILSCLMSGVIAFVNILHNVGMVDRLLQIWLSGWLFSWLVGFPTVLILLPVVRKMTSWVVDTKI